MAIIYNNWSIQSFPFPIILFDQKRSLFFFIKIVYLVIITMVQTNHHHHFDIYRSLKKNKLITLSVTFLTFMNLNIFFSFHFIFFYYPHRLCWIVTQCLMAIVFNDWVMWNCIGVDDDDDRIGMCIIILRFGVIITIVVLCGSKKL